MSSNEEKAPLLGEYIQLRSCCLMMSQGKEDVVTYLLRTRLWLLHLPQETKWPVMCVTQGSTSPTKRNNMSSSVTTATKPLPLEMLRQERSMSDVPVTVFSSARHPPSGSHVPDRTASELSMSRMDRMTGPPDHQDKEEARTLFPLPHQECVGWRVVTARTHSSSIPWATS